MEFLERSFKIKVTEDLKTLNGEEFERFSRFILELALNEKVYHKGQNLYAKPVGYTADFADASYEIIDQSGTDEDYFEDFKKPLKDITTAIKNHSTAKKIYLFSNKYAGTSRIGKLIKEAKANSISQTIIPYDAEKIAETILEKILASHIIEQIFFYLPTAHILYRLQPQNMRIPSHKEQYYRRSEEKRIIAHLGAKDAIQIFGLSGIGKTEITIAIAKSWGKSFQTVLWIEGDSIQNRRIDFHALKIFQFDKLVNLLTILETFKVLVIFDNVNSYAGEVIQDFSKFNKHGSKALITSIAKSVSDDFTFPLNEVSETIATKILFGEKHILDKNKSAKILNYTSKHPLILRIIQSAVSNEILDWDDLLLELESVNQLADRDRNQTISNRIIERIRSTCEKELFALKYINNRLVCIPLLQALIGKIGINKLIENAVIGKDDNKYYSIHQIILDSINTELKGQQYLLEFNEKIKQYLIQHNEVKDAGFYSVVYNHLDLVNNLFDTTGDLDFKRIIVYSLIQCTDIKYSAQADALAAKAAKLISNNTSYYEQLLTIELGEIRLLKIDKKYQKVLYESEARKEINMLTALLVNATDITHRSTLIHHIGKFYFKLDENKTAEDFFSQVLALKPNDPFALLQVARIASRKRDVVKVTEITDYIFELTSCPLSILLSFYELIANNNNFPALKVKYIDQQIDVFSVNLLDAIDSRYDQPYNILAKTSRHLAYNFPQHFDTIIDNLPAPSNLEFNEDLRFNYALIFSSYYKFGDKALERDKMNHAFLLAKANLEELPLDNDYQRGIYVDLLIAKQEFDLALVKIGKFEEKNEFYFQKLVRYIKGLGLTLKRLMPQKMRLKYTLQPEE